MYKRLPGAESCPKKVAPGFEAPKFSLPARSERVLPPVSLLPLSHTSSSVSLFEFVFWTNVGAGDLRFLQNEIKATRVEPPGQQKAESPRLHFA